ncbi:MAG: cell division protein FtsI [Clostridia bacterium]|nr:cell division protein FtsI [Clostridia bacterium]
MRRKLVWLFGIVVLALVGLSIRITYINASEGIKYSQQVLSQSQQRYDSRVIPFKRGDIKDRNGAVLATSEKVYKVILDCKVVNSDEDYIEPTVKAMVDILGLDEELIRSKLTDEETEASQYQIMKTNVSITEKKEFEEYEDPENKEEMSEEEQDERDNVKGVWFEEDYLRTYPLGSTASDLIGFTYTGNTADWGIEGYYSSTLNGVNGRQYGYFNSDADVEQTIIEAEDGNSVISTVDVNIQQVVEKYIQKFMDGMSEGPSQTGGAKNVGVIVANPNNGEILAMASNDPYDLNDPRNLTSFYTQEEIDAMDEASMLDALNGIWKNYCISDTFEPGSTVKPLTVGAALESNAISPDAEYYCDGYQMFGDTRIRCSIYPGAHGQETVSDLIKNSCNDGLMQIAESMGAEDFLRYQEIFNFGSTTGIDLPGEATGIIHTVDELGSRSTELATSSFGQGYTCTMIQEVAAISSVINGGYYYQPQVVSKVLDENGNVIKNEEPVLMKQTISTDVSSLIREYMGTVMEKGGTGNAAKVDGYSMGGKTGTAQKIPRADKKYLVSFVGFAPLDDPQVVIYVVVDEPNAEYQADSKYAQYIAKQVMKEILPYLNIFPDQELTGSENGQMTVLENTIEERAAAVSQARAAGLTAVENGTDTGTTDSADAGSSGAEGTDAEGTDASAGDTQEGDGTSSTDTGSTSSGETIKEGTDDLNVPEPPVDEEDTDLNNKQETDGITNEEAGMEAGN